MNSTFRWEFYLTQGHPLNKVAIMDGYSKGAGFENPNKVLLMLRKLENPVLPYLTRCDTIVIYEQIKGLPKDYHTKIIELYPREYSVHGWVKDDLAVNQFLDAYYTTYVRTGKMPAAEDRRKNARKAVYMEELDHSRYNFQNQKELVDFCKRLVPKYSYEAMKGWYQSHSQFQPELFENNIVGAMTQAIHEAPNLEQAQAAQAAIGGLLNKFTGQS